MTQVLAAEFLLVGLNHRVASVEDRGRLALPADRLPGWLAALVSRSTTIREAFALSTCNRLEIYVAATDLHAAEDAIRDAMAARAGVDLLAPGGPRYRLAGDAIVEHLYRVACGLESMLVGEAEIVGQVRDAGAIARGAKTLGPQLDRLVTSAVELGRRVRQETRIGVGATSAAGAAVVLAERELSGLKGKSALVIGAGHAGRLALGRLAKRRPAKLLVANRSLTAAEPAAQKYRAQLHPLTDVPSLLADADVVIAAITADSPVVTVADISAAMARRPGRALVVIDLSVPAAADPGITAIEGVRRFDLESLRDVQAASAAGRAREIPRVEALIRQALAGPEAATSPLGSPSKSPCS